MGHPFSELWSLFWVDMLDNAGYTCQFRDILNIVSSKVTTIHEVFTIPVAQPQRFVQLEYSF